MKKLTALLVFALMACLAAPDRAVAQGTATLRVLNMPGFPVLPNDSAYEGQTYTFTASIFNGTNIQLAGTLELVIRVDTSESVLVANPASSIPPGDTVTLTISQYSFTQQLYSAGNNIVVVWPRFSGSLPPTDTLYANVFFVPLSSVGFPKEDNSQWINVFPNPAHEWTTIGIPENESVEYVRILDVSGKLVREDFAPDRNRIPTANLAPGVYFIQALSQKKVYRSSFIRME